MKSETWWAWKVGDEAYGIDRDFWLNAQKALDEYKAGGE